MSQPSPESSIHFGVDIGGTGIKGAPVDLATGKLTAERVRIATPQPATPKAISEVVGEVVKRFGWTGPIGAAFPAAVKGGVAMTAANVDKKWIGTNIEEAIRKITGSEVSAINDADAAGVAELAYGVGKGQEGVVIMTTFGTGIGTALFLHGQLVPNTELGHIEIDGKDAETRASEIVREKKGLSWSEWAKRVDRYLTELEALFWPDMIIIGGGASAKADKFIPRLTLKTKVVPAALQNEAGIVGAAVRAAADVTRPGASANPNPAAKRAAPARRAPVSRTPSPVKAAAAAVKAAATAVIAAVPTVTAPAKAPAKAPSKAPAKTVRRASARKAPAKATPAKAAPVKATPVRAVLVPVKAPAKKVATKAPAKKVATKAPAKTVRKAPARKAPAKATPVKATPAKARATKSSPAKAAPAKASPAKAAKATPTKSAPVRTTPVRAVPTPAKAPAKKAPAKRAPARATPPTARRPTI
jgi:polyphosphate glucokinase